MVLLAQGVSLFWQEHCQYVTSQISSETGPAQTSFSTNPQPVVRALRSMTTFLDKFREVDEAINSNEAEAEKWFEALNAERSKNPEGGLATLTLEERKSHEQLNALLDDLSRPIKRMEAELVVVRDWLSAESKTQILQWFSDLPYRQYHLQASTDVLAGTGDWLLQDARLQTWASSSFPSILWLRGPPGFGKTKLVLVLFTLVGKRHLLIILS